MSKIVLLVGSPRREGNTETLARAFEAGVRQKGHQVVLFSVSEHRVHPCIGCNTCFEREDHSCFQQDDMQEMYRELEDADVIAVASPVYFYGLSAQLKAVIDRLHTPMRGKFRVHKLALLYLILSLCSIT